MPEASDIKEATIAVQDIRISSFQSKTGQTVPKYELVSESGNYSAIGKQPAGLAKGDTVIVKYRVNGNFKNLVNIVKDGVPLMQTRAFNGGGGGGGSSRAMLIVAATIVSAHNSKIAGKAISPEDITAVLVELEKLAAK